MSARTKTDKYRSPRFKYQDILDELDAVSKAAGKLLAPSASHIIAQTVNALEGSRLRDTKYTWELTSPIISARSNGQHHPKSSGAYELEGRLSYIWEILPEKTGKKTRAQTFIVHGKVSTKIELVGKLRCSGASDEVLAAWRFEIGDRNAPGAFFHSQIEWHVPKRIHGSDCDVPRFASLLMTPGECLDFLLGELFQAEWPVAQQAHSAELRRWAANQKLRMSNLLDETKTAIHNSSGVSPWMALKKWKPENSDLLLSQ